jgi:oxygen-dependent protoporphyrinogen oxidase
MIQDVAIIGGGISGLAVAYDLRARGYQVAVLERQAQVGGKAFSENLGGFLMEHGPSTVSAESEAAGDLSRNLGLESARCPLGPGVRQRYLVGGGRLKGLSTNPFGFLLSDYLTLGARARLALEWAVPRHARTGAEREESVEDFFARRFGREFTARIVVPLVAGLYGGAAAGLSMSAVFPRLLAMECEKGSVTRAMLASRRRGGRMPGRGLFSWRGGIGTLPSALVRDLGDAVVTGATVTRFRPVRRGFRLDSGTAGALEARAVVVATQPHVTAQLLEGIDPTAADAAASIAAPPLAVVFLGCAREQVAHPLDGLGFLVPAAEGRNLLGAQFCSTMFPGRAPQDQVALAAYVGGTRQPDLARLEEKELIALVREEFRDLLGLRGEPAVTRVRHWPVGIPQFRLGHAGLVTRLRQTGRRQPGLFVIGNFLSGPSVGACLGEARQAACEIDAYLATEHHGGRGERRSAVS